MTDLAVSERRIRPIQDAVAAGNWKQALSLCEKWQKKGEKSDRFLALKASILVNQSDKVQVERGKVESLQLCRRPVPVTDIEALFQLQDTLKRLSLQNEEGPKLWDRAIGALPNDKNLIMTWLKSSMSDNNWFMAQKAAMALRKAFPRESQYEFWNVMFCYLVHRDVSKTEKERTLFGTLAYRLMSKIVEASPIIQAQSPLAVKAISTPEELALLTNIYVSTDHTEEAIKLLQGNKIGLESTIAEQDPAMVFSLLLASIKSCRDGASVLATCQKLLSDSDPRAKEYAEDDRIWRILLERNDGRITGFRDNLLKLVDSVLARQPDCRAVHLVKLDILTSVAKDLSVKQSNDSQDLATAILAYHEKFGEKPFVFDDMATAVQACAEEQIQPILQRDFAQDDPRSQSLLRLKIDYSKLSEVKSHNDDFLRVASQAIRVHKQISNTKADCPEAVLLAALSLLRLASRSPQQNIALAVQAGFLLESTSAKFVEYYPLATRLVQLYRSLGQMSMAADRFTSLSVKNMQWETIGHMLLTRISSLHPLHERFDENYTDPLQALDTALAMLGRMENSLDTAIERGMENGSYANVLDSVVVKDNVQRSLNRQLLAIEERRIQDLRGLQAVLQSTPEANLLNDRPKNLVDLRDFSFLNGYAAHESQLDDFLSCGPLPREIWLDQAALSDYLSSYLRLDFNNIHASQVENDFNSLQQAAQRIRSVYTPLDEKSDVRDLSSELTEAEKVSLGLHQKIVDVLKIIDHQQGGSSRNSTGNSTSLPTGSSTTTSTASHDLDSQIEEITSRIMALETAPTYSLNTITIPYWQTLHTFFTQLESLKLTVLFTEHLVRRFKLKSKGKDSKAHQMSSASVGGSSSSDGNMTKSKIVNLKQACMTVEAKIHDQARRIKENINAGSGVLGKLIDVASGRVSHEEPSGRASAAAAKEGDMDMFTASKAYTELADECADLYDDAALEEFCGRMKDSWEDALDGVLAVHVTNIIPSKR